MKRLGGVLLAFWIGPFGLGHAGYRRFSHLMDHHPEKVGLVLGKFAPFHNGHEHLIREALKQSDRVVVLVYAQPRLIDIPVAQMVDWMRMILDDNRVEIRIIPCAPPHEYLADTQRAHLQTIRTALGSLAVDKVFGDQWYGADIAESLGATLVQIDPKRREFPVESKNIREEPHTWDNYLNPIVFSRVRLIHSPTVDEQPWIENKYPPYRPPSNSEPETKFKSYNNWSEKELEPANKEAKNFGYLADLDRSLTIDQKTVLEHQILQLNPWAKKERLLEVESWNLVSFQKPHLPVVIGSLAETHAFSAFAGEQGLSMLDVPLHNPGSSRRKWWFSKRLSAFQEMVTLAVAAEKTVNPDFEKRFAYITVDQQVVPPDPPERGPGLHVDVGSAEEFGHSIDGILEERQWLAKQSGRVDHTYIAYDNLPPDFYEGPFQIDDSPGPVPNFETMAIGQTPVSFPPYTLLRLGPYDVHTSVTNRTGSPARRTFVKIQFTTSPLQQAKNGQNLPSDRDGRR